MDNSKTGGPAFPIINTTPGFQHTKEAKGMTLRDWFAGQLLASSGLAELNAVIARGVDGKTACRDLAKSSYFFADAMISARSEFTPSAAELDLTRVLKILMEEPAITVAEHAQLRPDIRETLSKFGKLP